jgi:hypothetical protein
MKVDPKYLREHYASLSDEALEEIDRDDLVEVAQKIYDDELARRRAEKRADMSYAADEEIESPAEAGDTASWLPDSSVVFSDLVWPGRPQGPYAANARDALKAAHIPCVLDLFEVDPPEVSHSAAPTHEWRLMVPGELNLQATSVLERDVFNEDFEAQWRTHLEGLSDQQVRAMNPRDVFCGLFDKVERVTRAYREELERRELK